MNFYIFLLTQVKMSNIRYINIVRQSSYIKYIYNIKKIDFIKNYVVFVIVRAFVYQATEYVV